MRLHTVFITFNRLELSKVAISSYLETVTVPYSYLVVDNASSDGTVEWLNSSAHPHLLLDRNYYPGYACNRGWELASAEADFLQRADNDNRFLSGWCEEVEACFQDKPELGQLGLRTDDWDSYNKRNVAGDCIVHKKLWDQGLRWEERPWGEYEPGHAESTGFAKEIKRMGYAWSRVRRPCIESFAVESPDDPYYIESWRVRGMLPWALKRHGFSPKEIANRMAR